MGKTTYKPEVGNEAPAVNEDEGPVTVKISITRELYDEYSTLAEKQGLTPAELMLHRLKRCVAHSSIRSIYLPESQVRQVEGILQRRPLETSDQLLALMTEAFRFRIDGFEPIQITPQRAKRIHLGAIGGQTPQQRLEMIIDAALVKATGL